MTRLPSILENALAETGLPWALEPGHGHVKIKLAGRLAGVIGCDGRDKGDRRGTLNLRAQIRRLAAEIQKNPPDFSCRDAASMRKMLQ